MRRDGALVTDTGSRAPQTCRGNAVIRPGRGGRSRPADSAPGDSARVDSARADSARADSALGDSARGDSGAWWAGDAPTGETAPPGPTTDATGAGTAGGAASGAVAATQVGEPGTASLPPLPPSTRERRPREPWIPEPPPFRTLSGPDIAGIVLLGALGIGVLVVLGLFVLNRFDQRDPVVAATPAASSSPAPSAAVTPPSWPGQPSAGPTTDGTATDGTATGPGRIRGAYYRGQLNPVTPAGVDASCTSRPTQNADGGTTRYDAGLVLDGNPETAWRCPGPAVGERLTIRFDQPTAVAELAIVNGYAKGRLGSGGDQYRKNRRVERVRYIFDGDRWVDQQLDPTDRSTQTIRIPATTTGRIIVEIREVSPGERDATAISELTFAGPQQG